MKRPSSAANVAWSSAVHMSSSYAMRAFTGGAYGLRALAARARSAARLTATSQFEPSGPNRNSCGGAARTRHLSRWYGPGLAVGS